MRYFKFFRVIFILALSACGGGKTEAPVGDKEPNLYFERQTEANCAIHAVNMAFGARFTTSDEYDRYMNLTLAAKNGFVSAGQQQALKDYYNTPGDEAARRQKLEQDFNAAIDPDTSVGWTFEQYVEETGIFGRAKAVEYILTMLNDIYQLGFPAKLEALENLPPLLAQNPPDFVNAERCIVDVGGHFSALFWAEENSRWYELDSVKGGPQEIAGNHIDWLRNLESLNPNRRVRCFTSADLVKVKEEAAKLREKQ